MMLTIPDVFVIIQIPISVRDVPLLGNDDTSVHTEESGAQMDRAYCLGVGWPGSVPFVSHRPGAYGRLLLAVYVQCKTGLLVSSDWFWPVTRGG